MRGNMKEPYSVGMYFINLPYVTKSYLIVNVDQVSLLYSFNFKPLKLGKNTHFANNFPLFLGANLFVENGLIHPNAKR